MYPIRIHAPLRLLGVVVCGLLACTASCALLRESGSDSEEVGSTAAAVTGGNILFVGNSFTHGFEQPAYSYNKASVTDTNGSNIGGIPGIFKKLTVQAGLAFNVSLETAGGQSLAWHLADRSAIIGQATWDTVVLQEQSITPLPIERGGSPMNFTDAARDLRALVLSQNPSANLFLYETWASPAGTTTQGYPAGTPGLQAMQADLRDAYFKASRELGFTGVVRVGDGFLRAIDQGLADPDPADGIASGMFNLWNSQDRRHSSRYGSYLSAAVLFAKITQLDPRGLATGPGSAATSLSISATDASNLHRIAYEIATLDDPGVVRTRLPVTRATFTGAVTAGTPVSLTGGAQLASLTTAEGTFSNFVGATAHGITGTTTPTSLGPVPANANAAASGLSAHDGANNVGAGNFQFARTFTAKTRFFIVETALASASVGDPTTVTLINASNQRVGTYSLSLGEGDFTATAAGNSSASLATLYCTQGVATVTGTPAGSAKSKLGGVSFSLADLGVTEVASVSSATGLRISSSTLDPNIVGLYTVP